MVVAGLLLGAAGSAFRLLGDAGRPAKIATVVTGVLCLLSGLALAGSWLAFLLPLMGLGLLFLALISDEVGVMNPRILVVQPEVDDPAHLFGDWLEEAGCTLEVVQPYAGDPVPTLDGYAGLLVMGGAMGANDDEVLDWIGPVKELIRDAVSEGVPTLGICLGHQLMGAALGGRVTPNPRGQQVGLIPVGWTEAAAGDRLFGGLATPRRGVQWNYDLVVEPPAEAVVLAQTPDGEVQVARFGPNAWGVQLHPEVDEAIVGTWVTDSERGELADRGLDADALLGEIKEAREELDHAWAPLAAGFADVALWASSRDEPSDHRQGAPRADGVRGPRVGRDRSAGARGRRRGTAGRADRPDGRSRPRAQPPGRPG